MRDHERLSTAVVFAAHAWKFMRRSWNRAELIMAIAGLLVAIAFGIHEALELNEAGKQLLRAHLEQANTLEQLHITTEEVSRAHQRLVQIADGQASGLQRFNDFTALVSTSLKELGCNHDRLQLQMVFDQRNSLEDMLQSVHETLLKENNVATYMLLPDFPTPRTKRPMNFHR